MITRLFATASSICAPALSNEVETFMYSLEFAYNTSCSELDLGGIDTRGVSSSQQRSKLCAGQSYSTCYLACSPWSLRNLVYLPIIRQMVAGAFLT